MVNERVVEQDRLVDVGASVASGAGRAPVGAQKTFRSYDPEQVLLISPVLAEWVPDGDLAHFVSDLVETGALDLGAIYASYEGERGQPPYDPRLMVKLLLYGYATATMSSRKPEAGTYRDIALRMLCADQHPDFRSIARFRARHLDALAGLFVQALRLCRQAGLVGLGALALDGTKLRANASRHKAMSYDRMGPKAEQLEAEIAELQARMVPCWPSLRPSTPQRTSFTDPTGAATSCPASLRAARRAWPRSARRWRHWRSRRAKPRPNAAL